jgi:tRNA threonylcarbamoyladenosine biosynthesis protein TsaB
MLLPTIDLLVRGAGLTPGDIRLVAISVGPGGFTGLRVAVATAKALWLGVGAGLVAVPSAMVVARTAARKGGVADGTCGVVLAGKQDTAWLERIQLNGSEPSGREAGLFTAQDAPLTGLTALIADAHLPESWSSRARALQLPLVSAEWNAQDCLTLGEGLLERQGPTDPLSLEPIYPRQPEAVTLWEGRAGRAGSEQKAPS